MNILDKDYTKTLIDIIYEIDEETGEESLSYYDFSTKFTKRNIVENIVEIMLHIDEIDEKISDISILKRLFIYEHLFNGEIYDKIYNLFIDHENIDINHDHYLKYFFYGAIVCEIYKYCLVRSIKKATENLHVSNQIAENSIFEVCRDKQTHYMDIIKRVYSYILKKYSEDHEFCKNVRDMWIEEKIPIDL